MKIDIPECFRMMNKNIKNMRSKKENNFMKENDEESDHEKMMNTQRALKKTIYEKEEKESFNFSSREAFGQISDLRTDVNPIIDSQFSISIECLHDEMMLADIRGINFELSVPRAMNIPGWVLECKEAKRINFA